MQNFIRYSVNVERRQARRLQRILILGTIAILGCATGGTRPAKSSAAVSTAGAVAGQPVTERDLQNIAKQAAKDPDARSAVEAIAGSLDGQPAGVKYCPIDGKRFDAHFQKCPEHGVELKSLE
jgi:hypothetical protein